MSQNVNKQYFIDMMASRRLSMRALAIKMGMNHSQLSLTLSGQRKMQLEEASQLSQIFGVPLHEIALNAGVEIRPTSGRRVPVIGSVGGDGSVAISATDTTERTDAPDDLPDDCVAVQCRTAESPLSWMDGCMVFFRRADGPPGEAVGRFSICKIKDGPGVLAYVRRGYREGTYNLSGPFSQENVTLEWATPVLVTKF
ncbi:helix-turn-helix domain-containing protein [Cupriavidus metallidurans]